MARRTGASTAGSRASVVRWSAVPDPPALLAGRFVGRAGELRLADAACAAAAHGRGCALVVSGEAGIGKTRYCDEVARRARGQGFTVVSARCWVDGGAPPLWPWQRIVTELCGREAAGLLTADSDVRTVDPERFARFAAVMELLAAACERAPVCLVIDDAHGADPGTLLLARFVARSLDRVPLVLIVSRCSGEPARSPRVHGLLDDIERDATVVTLRPLDPDETAELIDAHGRGGIDPALVPVLHHVSRGNPLFLRRLSSPGARDGAEGPPAGLRQAIASTASSIGAETAAILEAAAVLGPSPSLRETAAVTAMSAAEVLDAVQRVSATGLVAPEGPDRFAFAHDLVRAAFEERLPVVRWLDAHASAAAAIAQDAPDQLARRARHALAASPRSPADGRRAVEACRVAADSMIRGFAYEQADELLSAATALHDGGELGRAPAPLLVEWARAALLCGRLAEARSRFERAARVAQMEGDRRVVAEAAIGLGGVWVNEHRSRVERGWVLALQRAALADLPEHEVALRCRLRARLAAEDAYDGAPLEPVEEALAAARTTGDPDALTEALSLCHHAMLGPEHVHRRLELADELVAVASAAGRGTAALMGLCWRTVDLFHLGDPGALRAHEELRQRADALACRSLLYVAEVFDVMLLIRAGRLDVAEERAARCHERGVEVGDVDASAYHQAQLLAIRWLQGREAELADLAERVATSPTLVQSEFAFRATAACLALRAGRQARARAALDVLVARGLAALPRSSTWLAGMHSIVEAAGGLGDDAVAREAYELLRPCAGLPVMPSIGVVCLGSTERALGLAAMTCGEIDRAVAHFERAIPANRRLGNNPLTAISQADLADALCRRAAPGDVERATHLLAGAVAEGERMRLEARVARWRAHLAAIRTRPGAGDRGGAPSGIIRREGGGWLVELDDHRALVADRVGMRYLATLLTRPGEDIPALSLASGGRPVTDPAPQPVLDGHARAAYVTRARELAAEVAEAEEDADIGRAEKLRLELDALVDELQSTVGLGGRSRAFAGPGERARTAVRKAITRAIDQIGAAAPGIADAVRPTISTGWTCRYTPDTRAPVVWSSGGARRPPARPRAHSQR